MHQVLLPVAVQGRSTLGKLLVLVRQELLLVIETIANVGVVHAFVLHNTAQEVLVVCL